MLHITHYKDMIFIMILSGLLSTMNIWTDKYSDMNISLNDIYMIALMTGWMLLFMSINDKQYKISFIGVCIIIISIICIRTQFMITEKQYIRGMIPHHSMAVHMSKKLLNKKNNMSEFLKNIVDTQEKEIEYMKLKIVNNDV